MLYMSCYNETGQSKKKSNEAHKFNRNYKNQINTQKGGGVQHALAHSEQDEPMLHRQLLAAATLLASATDSALHFTITLRSLFDCCVQDAYSVSDHHLN